MKFSRNLFVWLTAGVAVVFLAASLLPLAAEQSPADTRTLERQRQEALRREALRLVELSAALHKEIEKSNENVLSLTILRKAEEVERLAHQLYERAKE